MQDKVTLSKAGVAAIIVDHLLREALEDLRRLNLEASAVKNRRDKAYSRVGAYRRMLAELEYVDKLADLKKGYNKEGNHV